MEGRVVRVIGKLAYRMVIPLFISMPAAWMVLNLFRAPLYTGAEPSTAFFLVVTAQHYIERTAWILMPVVVGVAIHFLWRWIRELCRT
jgi:hypothetical protein